VWWVWILQGGCLPAIRTKLRPIPEGVGWGSRVRVRLVTDFCSGTGGGGMLVRAEKWFYSEWVQRC